MNQLLFGKNLSSLRKKRKLTQAALAEILSISDKAVSKWETGLGYPEITLLPMLANALGVTVDFLLSGKRDGIAIIGNLHYDTVRYVDTDHRHTLLSNVTSISHMAGGCVPNIALNLSKIDPTVPLIAMGCVGNDENGRYILARLQRHLIKTSNIICLNEATGVNDIISFPFSARNVFRYLGANAKFDPATIDIKNMTCRIAHWGRLSLFPHYWEPDEEYGCKLARLLHDMQSCGIRTSVSLADSTSQLTSDQYSSILKYCDYLIIAYSLPKDLIDDSIQHSTKRDQCKFYMQRLLKMGVREKVFLIENQAQAYCLSKDGHFSTSSRKEIPLSQHKSQKGIADEFCSGCLYGIYNSFLDEKTLDFALAVTTAGLIYKVTDDSMKSQKELYEMLADKVQSGNL